MLPPFVFAIALEPRSASAAWRPVENDLRRTIRSGRASDPAATVIVACHDEPEPGEVADGVITLRVPFPEPTSPTHGGRDKAEALSGYRVFGGAVVDAAKGQAQLSDRFKAVRS